ncbi:LysR family transcriptional regulator [Ligilactobacillus salitolerans]|uniref:LysR family transcriptional regulator n=1 Tax=Ligilactobacillus salitolerans TaxID=1808352 RepID=A0A401IQT3_9LACO|nr:LysR family transcriptional regulator [Ligilactobacillus salitolerans]GBG93886.1 LysR family transcriptional regulator [Ligilactobacillus salitolerans]
MDIVQLIYFINIVECDYNLSLAAKKIHISQSALSQFISNFEYDHDILLFHRKNKRLYSLTRAGEKIYEFALKIVDQYEEMEEMVRIESLKQKGTIRIGMPSLILRVYFSNFFPHLLANHPEAHIEITEGGSNELRRKLINDDLDIAILIEPTNLDIKTYEQHVTQIDEMVAFFDRNHPLNKKETLKWSDLKGYPIGTFNKEFMTYSLVQEKLRQVKLEDQIKFTSSSWDYLIDITKDTDVVTIISRPIEKYLDANVFATKHFKDFIPFNFHLCRPIKNKYSSVENLVFNDIINHFYQPI